MKIIKKIFGAAWYFICKVIEDHIGLYAAQASFFIMVSVIPLIMFILTIAKLLLPFFISEEYILTSINHFVPPPIDSYLTTIVAEIFGRASNIQVMSVTFLTAVWLASRGFMAISQGINNVFNNDRGSNYFYYRAVSLVYTLFFSAALVLTIAVFGFGSKITAFISGKNSAMSVIIDFILRTKILLFTVMLSLFFAVFYHFMGRSKLRFKHQFPGAVCAAAGWMIFSWGYSIYIKYFSRYTYVYGSLTAVVFLMLWLYFCMNILLYGAEINKLADNLVFP